MDNIANINGNAAIVTGNNERPWHGLGTTVSGCMTTEEAIKQANLDWDTPLVPVLWQDPDTEEIHRFGDVNDTGKFVGKRVVLNGATGKPLGVVGAKFVPNPNRQCFSFFDKVLGDGQAQIETAGALGNGETVWMQALLKGGEFEVLPGDVVERRLLLKTGHAGNSNTLSFFTPTRVVCQNTLNVALKRRDTANQIQIRHSGNVTLKMEMAAKLLRHAGIFFDEVKGAFQFIAAKQVKQETLTEYFIRSIGQQGQTMDTMSTRSRNQVLDFQAAHDGSEGGANSIRGTLWGAYNAVTYTTDHTWTDRKMDKYGQREAAKQFFEGGVRVKEQAFNVAVDMANTLN